MKETQEKTGRGDEPTGVPPTDPDRGNRQATAPAPAPAEKSGLETVDFVEVPPTDPGTDHGTGSFIGGDWANGAAGDTESFAASPSDQITITPESGDTTAGATASGRDRNATDAFALDPQFQDPERTLPPSANERPSGLPRIAGYEVLEVLGEGGMGIVYKAHHLRLKRFVALKMIRGAAGARPQVLDRFDAEARAVAGIDHPNIVKIFDIGDHDGQPYFSLEYLGGGSLAKKVAGKPHTAVEAARIVEVLARAVNVAHHKKIIHRDLKPANVLIGDDGTLKISDFGLVKQLEGDSGQTISGAILGTPSYMAPEQARGELRKVGTAADQYALGTILYELLIGRPPFQGMSTLDTLDMVRGKEPVPPSQLQPRMPRDIETICLKCLQKDPSRRYTDVLALAEDLRRFQAGEPIVARPVSGAERLWRWCLRNKRVASLYSAVALLFVTVLVVLAVATVTVNGKNQKLLATNAELDTANDNLNKEKVELAATNANLDAANDNLNKKNVELVAATKLAHDRRKEAEEQREKAESNEKKALKSARAATAQNQSLVDSQVELIGLLERRLRHVPAIQADREQMLDKAATRLEAAARAMTNLRNEIGWDPKDEVLNWRTLTRAHRGLAELSLSRNQFTEAMKHFRQAEEILITLEKAVPDDMVVQINLVRIRRNLGFVAMYNLGNAEQAQEFFQKAIVTSRKCLAKKPDNDAYKSELANALGHLAMAEKWLGHLDKARDLFREEIAIRKSYSPAELNRVETRRELAGLYEQLADLNLRMGDKAEGLRLYDECAAIRIQVASEQPDSWPVANDRARSYNNDGMIRFPYGHDPAAAREFHRKAIAVFEQRVAADPADFDAKSRLAQTLYYEATCALHSGDTDGASAGYRRCLEIYKMLATEPAAKMQQADLMLALARCGKHAEAAKIAKVLLATPPTDERHYFQIASGYSLAAGAAKADADLVRQYTDAAIDCLRRGKARGWADLVTLEIDPDLEPIRKDPGFQKLLGEFPRPKAKRT